MTRSALDSAAVTSAAWKGTIHLMASWFADTPRSASCSIASLMTPAVDPQPTSVTSASAAPSICGAAIRLLAFSNLRARFSTEARRRWDS